MDYILHEGHDNEPDQKNADGNAAVGRSVKIHQLGYFFLIAVCQRLVHVEHDGRTDAHVGKRQDGDDVCQKPVQTDSLDADRIDHNAS